MVYYVYERDLNVFGIIVYKIHFKNNEKPEGDLLIFISPIHFILFMRGMGKIFNFKGDKNQKGIGTAQSKV